MNVLVSPIYRF